eukprot:Awhi_evm1s10649
MSEMICCIISNGERCSLPAGTTGFTKTLKKIAAQKKMGLEMDAVAGHQRVCQNHKTMLNELRPPKRPNGKRTHSENF